MLKLLVYELRLSGYPVFHNFINYPTFLKNIYIWGFLFVKKIANEKYSKKYKIIKKINKTNIINIINIIYAIYIPVFYISCSIPIQPEL